MNRSSTAGEADNERPKRAKVESWDTLLKDKFGLQWVPSGPNIRADLKAMYVLHTARPNSAVKVAVFDMDWTVIKPKSGGKWPKGPSDWCWLYPQVPDKMKQLVTDEFRLIIVSNQNGIEKRTTKAEDIMQKIGEIVLKLDVPVEAMFFTGESHFRKPAVGGWDHYVQKFLPGVELDLAASIYVGDAAGRAKDYRPGRKKDFSCSDRMFADNINIGKFQTPEEFFLGEKPAPFTWFSVSPADIINEGKKKKLEEKYHSDSTEMVLMVGPPASGKSWFTQKYLVPHGYERVNRDEMKTQSKCLEVAKNALSGKRSVVVDNTNPNPSDRKQYVELAKKQGVPCRCFVMDTPLEWASHLNYYRQAASESKVRRIPKVAYNMYKSRHEAPKVVEGFAEVKTIPFVPHFKSEKERRLFMFRTTDV